MEARKVPFVKGLGFINEFIKLASMPQCHRPGTMICIKSKRKTIFHTFTSPLNYYTSISV